jgi:hypothetical protein
LPNQGVRHGTSLQPYGPKLTGMPTLAPPVTAEWLEIVHTGKSDWRVGDSRRDAGDPGGLLGFIERLGRGRYEILWLTEPPRWGYADSLKGAIVAFDESVDFAGTKTLKREEARKLSRRQRRWDR